MSILKMTTASTCSSNRAARLLNHLLLPSPSYHSVQNHTHQQTETPYAFNNPNLLKFYIDGEWVDPIKTPIRKIPVISPATEAPVSHIAAGTAEDVDRAVAAASRAFETFSRTTREERIKILENILKVYKTRFPQIAQTITLEMGCPISLSSVAQAGAGAMHIVGGIEELKKYEFEEKVGNHLVVKEPIGVVGMITPWNWPINQISCKVVPAIACGCTMVLKPSELSPLDAIIWAEILHEAGVPKGVFNLVHGTGDEVGEAISRHPAIHAVTFTGSTRAGILVAKAAAETVKRVSQELGGKSPHIILRDIPDTELADVVTYSIKNVVCSNTGQSCNAPTRILVPIEKHDAFAKIAKDVVGNFKVGNPWEQDTAIGPVANVNQWHKVQSLIQSGIQEGATVVVGGVGRPEGLSKGYFVKPTVFANVKNDMKIAREEIFGPVVCILPYRDEEEAIRIANDTPYGLSSEISGRDLTKMHRIASRIRAGTVRFNNASVSSFSVPFGGYKQSGNGREWGKFGFHEYLEVKSILLPRQIK